MVIKTVADAIEIHKKMMQNEGRYNSRYRSCLKKVLPFFGKLNIYKIPKYVVDEYYREQCSKRGVKKQTISREIAIINASFGLCFDLEYITTNPRKIEANYKSGIRTAWLNNSEIKKLLNSTRLKRNPQVEKACKIALTTTARKDAIVNLRVEQICWDEGERGLINFNASDMKNKAKPRAIVPVPKSIEKMLRKCCEESKQGWVLQTRRGNKIADPLYVLKKCVQDTNLNEHVCFHTLRHTGAVHMAKNNVPLLELSRYMGHTKVDVTERVYAKFYPDFMQKSSEVAGDLINVD